jgi:L-iditol 2-dehydrogenase
MNTTMRQVLVAGLDEVTVVDSPIPVPGEGEARVAITLAGICGSDTHAIAGHHPMLSPPYYPGHELVGIVDECGPGAEQLSAGQRVLVKPNVECGTCVNCRAGRTNGCQTLQWIGCDPSGVQPGGMAEFLVAPVANIFVIPEGVSDNDSALLEPLATPVHAVRLAGVMGGANVVILGAGTIGLLSLIAARAAGAGKVVVTDMEQSKIDRALEHGADDVVAATAEDFASAVKSAFGGLADVVLDCVGVKASIRQAISVLRRTGTVMIVGVPPRDDVVQLPLVQDWELRVQGSANYTAEDIKTAIDITSKGMVLGDAIVSHRFGIEDAVEAFAVAAQGVAGKVVIDLRPGGQG